MSVGFVTKLVQLACDGVDVADNIADVFEAQSADEQTVAQARAVLSALQLICGGAELGGKALGTSNRRLAMIKGSECFIRLFDTVMEIESVATEVQAGRRGHRKALEAVSGRILGLLRTAIEHSVYRERNWIGMTDEERAKERRKVGTDPDTEEAIYGPVILEECQTNLANAEAALPGVAMTEIGLRAGVISKTVTVAKVSITHMYDRLARRLVVAPVPVVAGGPAAPLVAAAAPAAPGAPADPFDFIAHAGIPEELHDVDPLFVRYRCIVGLGPMRDPVGDPTSPTALYERATILRILRADRRPGGPLSPATNVRLVVAQLVEKPVLRGLINRQLRFHGERLRLIAQNLPHPPIAAADQANLLVESPGM